MAYTYVVKIDRIPAPEEGTRYPSPETIFSVHVTEPGALVVQEAIMGAMLNPPKAVEKIVVR